MPFEISIREKKQIKEIKNISILLIEQNVQFADEFNDRLILLKEGKVLKKDMSLKEIENEYFKITN